MTGGQLLEVYWKTGEPLEVVIISKISQNRGALASKFLNPGMGIDTVSLGWGTHCIHDESLIELVQR